MKTFGSTRHAGGLLAAIALAFAAGLSGQPVRAEGAAPGALPPAAEVAPKVYRLYEAFYARTNPNGVWSFGWKDTLASPFNLLTNWAHALTHEGAPIEGWSFLVANSLAVLCNTNERPFNSRFAVPCPKNSVWISGSDSPVPKPAKFGVVRFTAPEGVRSLYRFFGGASSRYKTIPTFGDAEFHVLQGRREIFERQMPRASSISFTNTVTLSAGDTIDFVAGPGQDGKWNVSDLYLGITITRLGPAPPARPAGESR